MGTRQTDKRVHDRRINTFLHTPRDQATRNITLAAPMMTARYCRHPIRAIVRTTRPPARTSRTGSLITAPRSEEHTSELQSLMRISYAVFCLKKQKNNQLNQK